MHYSMTISPVGSWLISWPIIGTKLSIVNVVCVDGLGVGMVSKPMTCVWFLSSPEITGASSRYFLDEKCPESAGFDFIRVWNRQGQELSGPGDVRTWSCQDLESSGSRIVSFLTHFGQCRKYDNGNRRFEQKIETVMIWEANEFVSSFEFSCSCSSED